MFDAPNVHQAAEAEQVEFDGQLNDLPTARTRRIAVGDGALTA